MFNHKLQLIEPTHLPLHNWGRLYTPSPLNVFLLFCSLVTFLLLTRTIFSPLLSWAKISQFQISYPYLEMILTFFLAKKNSWQNLSSLSQYQNIGRSNHLEIFVTAISDPHFKNIAGEHRLENWFGGNPSLPAIPLSTQLEVWGDWKHFHTTVKLRSSSALFDCRKSYFRLS